MAALNSQQGPCQRMHESPSQRLVLQGQRIAFTGKLAALSRSQAEKLVGDQGGLVSAQVTSATTLLVVGADGWPLRKDGRLTTNLRRARLLARLGNPIEIVEEAALLQRLGQTEDATESRHSLSEVVHLLGVSGDWIRAWVRHGLLKPHAMQNEVPYFTFAQVTRMRSLCNLLRAGVSTQRLRRSLRQLFAWLPATAELAANLTQLDGVHALAVRLEDGRLLDPHGQLHLDFESSDAATLSFTTPEPTKSALDFFTEGCAFEEAGNWVRAAEAYRQALLAGGPSADACYNLANVLVCLGLKEQASERYRQVLELDPDNAAAWNNLGNVLSDLRQYQEAVKAYQQAITHDPAATEARYNLADLLDRTGSTADARAEWKAFLRYEKSGAWADYARRKLSS